jgi:hypothetical protein
MEESSKSSDPVKRVPSISLMWYSRQTLENTGVIPSDEEILGAKRRYEEIGLRSISTLIDAVLMIENKDTVVCFFGFSYDSKGLVTELIARGAKKYTIRQHVESLPSPEWGDVNASTTVLRHLVDHSDDPLNGKVSSEDLAFYEEMFNAGVICLSRGTCAGKC